MKWVTDYKYEIEFESCKELKADYEKNEAIKDDQIFGLIDDNNSKQNQIDQYKEDLVEQRRKEEESRRKLRQQKKKELLVTKIRNHRENKRKLKDEELEKEVAKLKTQLKNAETNRILAENNLRNSNSKNSDLEKKMTELSNENKDLRERAQITRVIWSGFESVDYGTDQRERITMTEKIWRKY